ncbi:MAG: tetratricopeptide repeat protein [Chitinophagales bacterium]
MQKLLNWGIFVLLAVALIGFNTDDAFAQKKKKKKKKKKGAVEVVEEAPVVPPKPDINTAAADAFLQEDATLWGPDSVETVKNYSLYREFYKQKNFNDAIAYWRYIYKNAPKARKTPYLDGEKMYKHYFEEQITAAICTDGEIEGNNYKLCKEQGKGYFKGWKFQDDATAQAMFDTLFMLYDQRAEYFGEEGYLTTKKSIAMAKYYPQKKDEVLELRKKALDIEQEETQSSIVYYVFKDIKKQFKDKAITLDSLKQAYESFSEINLYNVENNEKYGEKYQKIQDGMDTWMGAVTKAEDFKNCDCATIKDVMEPGYLASPNDVKTIKSYYNRLKRCKCTSNPIYSQLFNKLIELEPSASRYRYKAQQFYKSKDFANAKSYYLKSLELENDQTKKAGVYMLLANMAYSADGNKSAARDYAQKAAEMRAGYGKPYLLIGDMYLSSKGECGNNVYFAAYDMYKKAKNIDPSLINKAAQKMSNASKGFPTKQSVFMSGGSPGARVSIGCWINQSTTVKVQ